MTDPIPPEKPVFEQKVTRWRERYEHALMNTMERARIKKKPPPVTEDGVELASFNDRLFASAIDSVLTMIFFGPVLLSIAKFLHGGRTLQEMLVNSPEFASGNMAMALGSSSYIFHFMLENIVNFSLMGVVIIYMWMYSATTPGKWLLRMRIVDEKTYGRPTNRQYVIRYAAYILDVLPLGLGFFWIAWDKKKQGWHDKLAHTLVIKVKHWRLKDAPAAEPTDSPPPSA
ncbi:MAG: RDD family protein [Rickettsiales bacterium]